MKYVHEMTGAKSAFVILNRKREHVATVLANYSNNPAGSVVTVEVRNFDGKTPLQQRRAGGYGYDKFSAALAGLVIDGHKMTDHCGARLTAPRKTGVWPSRKAKRGYTFANYSAEKGGFTDCYRMAGLDYLRALGYTVIDAI